jgi:hypothetical protein
MKLRITESMASPTFTLKPGDEHDFADEAEAQRMIVAGFARPADEPIPDKPLAAGKLRIRMKEAISGMDYSARSGQEIDVEENEARRLEAAGFGILVSVEPAADPAPEQDPAATQPEGAMREPAVGEQSPAAGTSAPADADRARATFEQLTVAELRDLAGAMSLDLGDATRKADIIDRIQAHAAANQPPT